MGIKQDLHKAYRTRTEAHKSNSIYWLHKLLSGLGVKSTYQGQLYRPLRMHEWAALYDQMRSGSPAQRRQARLKQLPRSNRWNAAYTAALTHWENACAVCGKHGPRVKLLRDHIVPISHAQCPGSVPSNMLILCKECNRLKYNNDLADWLIRRNTPHAQILKIINHIWLWQEKCWQEGWR